MAEPREVAGRLAEEAAEALERGNTELALSRADAACSADPSSVAALHYRSAALAELGRFDDAKEAYERALDAGPSDLDLLLGAADFYVNLSPEESDRDSLERGLSLAYRGLRRARRARSDVLRGEFALLCGSALNELGETSEALSLMKEAVRFLPDDPRALLEHSLVLFELCRFDEARRQLCRVVRLAPEEAWAHHTLGLIAEQRGEPREAERHFARARRLAPAEFPEPPRLSPSAFDAVVEEAFESLPEQIRRYLSNVAIAVEEHPSDDDLWASDPPLSPSILGVFRGAPYGQKGSFDPWSHFPSSIVLYQRNLERFARSRRELIEQVGITLIHEVGHFLGLDEEELWERGLE